jgi:intracellular septation protein
MKLLLDFLPIVLFFITFRVAQGDAQAASQFASEHFGFLVSGGQVGPQEAPVLLATLVVMVASLAQIAWLLARRQKIDTMLWVSALLVTVLGGATVWFHSETFIKWKPTALYWLMGAAFGISQLLFKKSLPKAMMGQHIRAPEPVWVRLSWAWAAFGIVMGLLNLYVAYDFSTEIWVNFKLFGSMGLMLVFVIGQTLLLSRYIIQEEDAAATAASPQPGVSATPEQDHGR